mmetsp:Transcript_31800/g.57624  ORF Transcript_31800/g.57624 Transcript_31800/m.57624 type:complete len:111 (+) Transcript_31800:109-441(+)
MSNPFGNMDGGRSTVHIRVQQRQGRKCLTTIAGMPEMVRLPRSGTELPVDFGKILRALKRTIGNTNGVLKRDSQHGVIIQLQGDIRREVANFLVEETALITRDQIMIHGS